MRMAEAAELRFALNGRAGFQLHNALIAAAIASHIGIVPEIIRKALKSFESIDLWMPESFQVIDLDGISVVVDRPNPSWFLRPILRALRDVGANRVITVVGKLGGIPASDLPEVGRLLGRVSSLFVSHSENEEQERSASVRQGAAMNDIPPVILHTKTEGRAVERALSIARSGDLVLVLADRPAPLARSLRRNAARRNAHTELGAA
jgi:UDP-N-acetylmuramyl tripeptide synthase